MHSVRRVPAAFMVLALLVCGSATRAEASTCAPPKKVVTADPSTGLLKALVIRPACSEKEAGSAPGSGAQHASAVVDASPTLTDLCRTTRMSPQPPVTDAVWAGRTTGAIYARECPLTKTGQLVMSQVWLGDPPAPVTVSPAQLARRALATLRLPKPVVRTSPGKSTGAGLAVTWVNLQTWVWTEPATWRELSNTASSGPVWATVQVTPSELSFAPGDGGAAVSCSGPGRPWRPADANDAPDDGCGHRYRAVASALTATLSIHWDVSWTGSDGSSGVLPSMTTSASDVLAVQQIQVVN